MARRLDVSRRTFLHRAGLLVSSLGVGGGVASGLMDSILRKATGRWGNEALAATGEDPVHFLVELNFRAGFQVNSLFPTAGHADASGPRDPSLNFYNSPANVLPLATPPAGSRPVYFARFTANDGADALRQNASLNSGRLGIATSESVFETDDNHTDNFYTRAPNPMAPCPAVLHAALSSAVRPVSVQGVSWNNGPDVISQTGGLPTLQGVQTQQDFVGMFKAVPMYFSMDELKLLVGVINNGAVVAGQKGAIGRADDLFLARNVPGAAGVAQVSVVGRGAAQLDLANLVDATAPGDPVGANFVNGAGTSTLGDTVGLSNVQLSLALASAAKAFTAGLCTTFSIDIDSDDWHGFTPQLDDATSHQAQFNSGVGNALAGFLTSIAGLPDPFSTSGGNIADSILISISSEFSRTSLRLGGTDNGDGQTQFFAFIGSKVATGAYGDITRAGTVMGFDPVSGNTLSSPGANIPAASVWKTAGKLMGISDAALSGYVPDSMGASVPCLVR